MKIRPWWYNPAMNLVSFVLVVGVILAATAIQ